MRFLAADWQNRNHRLGINRPVKMLVVTFNKTLRGYIQEFVYFSNSAVLDADAISTDVNDYYSAF